MILTFVSVEPLPLRIFLSLHDYKQQSIENTALPLSHCFLLTTQFDILRLVAYPTDAQCSVFRVCVMLCL